MYNNAVVGEGHLSIEVLVSRISENITRFLSVAICFVYPIFVDFKPFFQFAHTFYMGITTKCNISAQFFFWRTRGDPHHDFVYTVIENLAVDVVTLETETASCSFHVILFRYKKTPQPLSIRGLRVV
jgi:hypothetical protein